MKNHMPDIRTSVDDYFADLDACPSIQNKVFMQINTCHKKKMKLSIGLVITLILVLVALSALAVTLLKGKAFLQQILMPTAVESESDKFTREELDLIMGLADQNEIELPALWKEKLTMETSEYKDEVLRAFMKSEFGFYPMAWPMEVQVWFDEVLTQLGYQKVESNLCLPMENDASQKEIKEIAQNYIIEYFNIKSDDLERDTCITEMVFYQPLGRHDPNDRQWDVEFFWTDSSLQSHTVALTPNGIIKEAN